MKYPLVTGFCGGLLIFLGCLYLGNRGAAIITFYRLAPMTFQSLKHRNEELRVDLLALQAAQFSQTVKDAPPDLERAAKRLETIRSDRSPEANSVLDLHVAALYVEAARLERESGRGAAADHYLNAAEGILHSLGWKDVSSAALADLTRRSLWWKEKR